MQSQSNVSATEIIDFWFSDSLKPYWFNSNKSIDDELRKRFELTYLKAKSDELMSWEDSTEGILALIILFDQIPLNIYRGLPSSFATEARANTLTKKLIAQQSLVGLDKTKQLFALLPLSHSEILEDHDLVLVTASQLGWSEQDCHWLKHHRSIVERFGRFPHRNEILGRQSSAEELEYISSEEAFKG